MQIGLLLIGSMVGACTAAALLMTGHSFIVALAAYSLAGALGTVVAMILGCALSRVFGFEGEFLTEN
jgi:hypothetical protein